MIMIKGSGGPDMMRGSYVIQVPNLAAALAAAEANGGKVQTTRFAAGGQESRHVFDPDGNDLEILQSGPAPKPAAK
jgi:predicted enzyme related to lactoylglutathione lyase